MPFILSQKANAMGPDTASNIATFEDLKTALGDANVGYINLAPGALIDAPEELVLSRSDVRINGNDSTITYTGAGSGINGAWDGTYVFQAYDVTNVEINSLRVQNADAGFLINGSQVTLKGNTHALNNEYGGIEVSKGSAPNNAVLTLEGNLWDESYNEANGKPAVWVINGQGSLVTTNLNSPLTSATHIKPAQTQYYLRAVNAGIVATNTTQNTTYATLQAAFDAANEDDTINLNQSTTVAAGAVANLINKKITFNGRGNTIETLGARGSAGDQKNAGLIVESTADGTTVQNVTFKGIGGVTAAHGLIVHDANGVYLQNLTAINNAGGVMINASAATLDTINTRDNAWYGVNIDKPGAILTVKGINTHNEAAPLFVDNRTVGQVIDVEDRYDIVATPGKPDADTYVLDTTAPAVPTHVSPSADARINYNNFFFDWSDPAGAVRYEIQNSQNSAVNGDGSLQYIHWTGDYNGVQPTESKAESRGANGTWYWQVRSIDVSGNKSAWSTPWAVTVDFDAPTADIIFPTAGPSATSFQVKFNEAVNQADAENKANYFLSNWPGAGGSGDLVGDATIDYDAATTTATVTFTNSDWYVSPEQKWEVKNIRDIAGNVLADWSEYSTPLVAPTLTGPTPTSPSNSLTQSWTWSATDPTDSTNASGFKNYEYAFVTGTDAPTTWIETSDTSYSTTVAGDGTYRLYVRAYDKAGNVTEQYSEVTVDTAAPAVEVTSFTSTRVAGTAEPGAVVTVIVDSEDPETVVADGDGAWEYTIAPRLTTGSHTVAVKATDGSNNESPTLTRSLTVPAPIVTAPVTEPPVAPAGGDDGDDNGDNNQFPSAAGNIAAILGTDTNTGEEVEGASSKNTLAQAVDIDSTDGTILGLAWYWWLLILAGIAAIIWWIAAAVRRRQQA